MEEGKKTEDDGNSEELNHSAEEMYAEDASNLVAEQGVEQAEATGDGADRIQGRLDEAYRRPDELQNKYLRIVAELDNLRKRSARERQEIATRTKANVIGDLLPTLDAFRLGLEDARKREEAQGVVDGFAMVMTQFESTLGEHGLLLIDPVGESFDPNLHEAVSRENTEEVDEGIVLSTVRAGYKLGGSLLRPAAVVISKGASSGEDQEVPEKE